MTNDQHTAVQGLIGLVSDILSEDGIEEHAHLWEQEDDEGNEVFGSEGQFDSVNEWVQSLLDRALPMERAS